MRRQILLYYHFVTPNLAVVRPCQPPPAHCSLLYLICVKKNDVRKNVSNIAPLRQSCRQNQNVRNVYVSLGLY